MLQPAFGVKPHSLATVLKDAPTLGYVQAVYETC